ncbi:MAG: hypothetical protein JSV22_03910 [Bacteroidales bacterium]|nr:MAG: hypothetical protein JSV22_03910 [Bacteroidales bacterium]
MNRLKLKTVLTLLLIIIVIGGCENLLNFTFESDYSTVDFIVNPDEAGKYVESYTALQANLDSIIEQEGYSAADLESVKLHEATVEVTGQSGNFDCVESIEIKIKAQDLDEITLASKDIVPDGLTFATLNLYKGELKEYLQASEYTVTLSLLLDQDLTEPMTIHAKLKYKITVGTL